MGPVSSKIAAWREKWDQALKEAEVDPMAIPVEEDKPLGGLTQEEFDERFWHQMCVFDLNKVGFLDSAGHRRYTNRHDFGYVTEDNFKAALSRIQHINPVLTDSGKDVRLLNDLVEELPHEFRTVPGAGNEKKTIEYVWWKEWVGRSYELCELFNKYRRGTTPRELREEGYSVEQFVSAGLRRYLHEAGFPADEAGGTERTAWDTSKGLNNSFELKRAGYTLHDLKHDAGIKIVDGRPVHTRADDILSNPEGSEVAGCVTVALSTVRHIDSEPMKGILLPPDFFGEGEAEVEAEAAAEAEAESTPQSEGADNNEAEAAGSTDDGAESVTSKDSQSVSVAGDGAKDDGSSVAESTDSSSTARRERKNKKAFVAPEDRVIPEGVSVFPLETVAPMQREARGSVMCQLCISSHVLEVVDTAPGLFEQHSKKKKKKKKKEEPKGPTTIYTVWIQFLAAENLLEAPVRTGDYYIIAELVDVETGEPLEGKTRRIRTGTVNDTTNPIWNEPVVEWAEIEEDINRLAIKITTKDADMFSKDLNRLRLAGYTPMELKKEAKFQSCHFRAGKFILREVVQAGIFGVGGCTKLRLAGYSIEELKAEFTVGQLRLGGFSPQEITKCGFTLEMIKQSNTTTVPELKAAGYTATEMRKAHYTALQMIGAHYTVPEMKRAGYTAAQLRYAKYPVKELVAAGFTAPQLKGAGCTAYDLNLVGFTAVQLRAAGYLARELAVSRYPVEKIKAAGYNATEMRAANLTAKELKDLEFTAKELAEAGFKLLELKKVDFTSKNLFDAGFHPRLLREVGFSLELVREGSGWESADLLHNKAGFTGPELFKSGYDAKSLLEAGCTVRYIKASGWHSGNLREAGVPLEELVLARFTAPQLVRDAGYDDPLELKDHGYKYDELIEAGFPDLKLVKYCKFTVKEVKKAMGYGAPELFKAGFYASELKVAGYTTERLVETGVLWAPRGVQHHVGYHVFDGWEFFKSWPYNHPTSGKDFRDIPEDATWLIIAARKLDAKELYIAAAGPRDVVLKKTTMNVANEANGTFWYRCPGRAFGFSDGRKVTLDTIADWTEPESDNRLSWVMDHKGWGGRRAGKHTDLSFDDDWEKCIWYA